VPKITAGFYRRELPELALSVERSTDAVPDDGKFYIVEGGHVVESFISEAAAVARFRAMAREMGFRPASRTTQVPSAFQEDLDRYFEDKELYWANSHKHRRTGGKGR
jgi:hypothetical protein